MLRQQGIPGRGDEIIVSAVEERANEQKTVVFTIGHSIRPVSEFIEMMKAYGIEKVVDIRAIPKSRYNPQFNKDTLRSSLKEANIEYLHIKGLGGLRHAQKDSPNMGWRNASFRGFADYMQTENFEENLENLIEAAEKRATVIMCSEAVPWRCHRSLIGDALLIRGVHVRHIMSARSSRDHTLTPWAKAKGGKITYPPEISSSHS
jgi:uncharacterized protein (DUF488 family)